MTDIAPLGHSSVSRAVPIAPGAEPTRERVSDTVRREADQVEVSPLARYLNQLRDIDTFRGSLVDQIKSQIESGDYETPDRLDGAIDALIEEEPGLFTDSFFNETA